MDVSPEGCALVWPDLRCRQGSARGLLVTQMCRGMEHRSHGVSVLWAVSSWEPSTPSVLPPARPRRQPRAARGAFQRRPLRCQEHRAPLPHRPPRACGGRQLPCVFPVGRRCAAWHWRGGAASPHLPSFRWCSHPSRHLWHVLPAPLGAPGHRCKYSSRVFL